MMIFELQCARKAPTEEESQLPPNSGSDRTRVKKSKKKSAKFLHNNHDAASRPYEAALEEDSDPQPPTMTAAPSRIATSTWAMMIADFIHR